MHKTGNDVKVALENTIATVQGVLKNTFEYAQGVGLSPKSLELKLVQSKMLIEEPKVVIKAEYL